MASIRSGTYKSHLWLTFDYSYSQNVANNNSSVSWSLVLHWDASLNFSASKSYSVTVNGTNYSGSYTGGASGGSGSKTIRSGTTSVGHNADGTKSVSVSASFGIEVTYSGTKISTMTLSGSFTLPTIPRASSFGAISGNTIGSAMTININRASTAFTHSLWYSFGNISWAGIGSGIGTSTTWTVPMELCNQIGNATSGTGTLILRTYNGSTQIGEDKYINFTVNVPASVVPWVSAPTVSEAISGLAAKFGGYVKGKSQLAVSISAGGSYSSWITQYSTSVSGIGTYGSASFTSGVLWNAGNVTITTTVTDSRGRTASASKTVTVLDYYSPSISKFAVVRCNNAGTVDENAGAYARITYAFAIASVSSKNTNSFALQYLNDSGNWTNLMTGSGYSKDTYYVSTVTFDVNKERQFRIAVTDYFGTWYAYATMAPTFTLVNFSSGGNGIAIGTTAEDNKFKIAIPVYYKNNLIDLGKVMIFDGYENGKIKFHTID
ncbi:DUF859 family phage minor structural protein [Candidatus Stoquefichus sp. SB1]|uniref:DUF859 family phage minor structural protein n=1 Tax=Candidatus Stoquefichus sp. SB1 TaxID=1658109 RepID=UPI00067EAD4C|nr:DUF859 family phage minor structural protein [Candidatus Stoquefichus sp. SB1]